jgi:hypothetical protein
LSRPKINLIPSPEQSRDWFVPILLRLQHQDPTQELRSQSCIKHPMQLPCLTFQRENIQSVWHLLRDLFRCLALVMIRTFVDPPEMFCYSRRAMGTGAAETMITRMAKSRFTGIHILRVTESWVRDLDKMDGGSAVEVLHIYMQTPLIFGYISWFYDYISSAVTVISLR